MRTCMACRIAGGSKRQEEYGITASTALLLWSFCAS